MQCIVIFVKKNLVIKKTNRKVRDHDHCTGKYRGAAHNICKLCSSTQKDIPALFHNGSNYDFNLIITRVSKRIEK